MWEREREKQKPASEGWVEEIFISHMQQESLISSL